MTVFNNKTVNKDIKIEKKSCSYFADNHILRLLDGWVNFPFTTSETKVDCS